ncbi:MAG TPA: hypothetical protein VFZ58_04115 [Candidatus Saccharimonadales bacterium]
MQTKINNEHVASFSATAETGPMGPERQLFLYSGSGEVRDRILNAPDWMRGEVLLPKDSVVVSMHVDDVGENSAIDMSANVAELLNNQYSLRSPKAADGYRRTGRFTSLSSLNTLLSPPRKHTRSTFGEPDRTVAFIYDNTLLEGNGEAAILPSAALIQGELTQEQLQGLRERFPGVPFVNKQNELLDDVGRDEREEHRKKYQQRSNFGKVAIREDVRLDLSKRTSDFMAQQRERFHQYTGDMERARQVFGDYLATGYSGSYKGEQYQSSVPPREKVKINKTHIPSVDSQKPGKEEWNVAPDVSAENIAQQAIDKIVPKGVVMTREKMNKFSNEVKKALSKERIHPDVDARASEVYSKIDDELTKRRNESRTTS